MELKDTIEGMLSDDYKERLIAEYRQIQIRIAKIKDYYALNNDLGDKEKEIMATQISYMIGYSAILAKRLKSIGINISSYEMGLKVINLD